VLLERGKDYYHVIIGMKR
jgi:hypothetical protein